MRALLAIVVLLALGWSGWWYVGATARERAVTRWLAERRDDGWIAEAEDVRVRGFPNRLDTIVTGLDLADPDSGWSWRAPEFQILSLSYKPHHFIAVWPDEQVVASPYETTTIETRRLRGSVVFEPNARLALDRTTIEIEDMTLRGDGGWQATVGRAVLATRQTGDAAPPFAHDVGLDIENLTLPAGWTAEIDRGGVLPPAIEAVEFDTTLVFDRPWDRPAVEGENPALEQVNIRDAAATWGRLDLRARGTLEADERGFAEGRIEIRARNWREMLEVAEAGGALAPALAGALRAGLGLFATLSGDSDSLTVPLEFDDGRTRLGPIELGDAPRLARR